MGSGYDRQWLFVGSGRIHVSPNGRYAVAMRPAQVIPQKWHKYTEHTFKDVQLPSAERDANGPNLVSEWILIDLTRATARPLLAAPAGLFSDAAWSADSRFVAVSPTFMRPDDADAEGLAGKALIVIDVVDGKVARVQVPPSSDAFGYRPIRWTTDGTLELTTGIDSSKPSLRLRNAGGKWGLAAPVESVAQKSVQVEIQQGLNEPPVLVARDIHTGEKRVVLDLNPSLGRSVTLAHVEVVQWQATDGKSWSGVLYRPVHYVAGKSYPLVIQTHGFSRTDFSPDGGFSTAYAAQALANHDIAVLQLGVPDSGYKVGSTGASNELQASVSGYEGAIRHFVAEGLVDPQKVGILGFSRTGWHVEYMLTHSVVRLAAAIAADNIEGGYFEYVFGENAARSEFDHNNYGVAPFGEGLQEWIKLAPGFNVDKVHTPLRLEFDSGPIQGIVAHWEFFSHLRYLGKPVELYVIPDIAHGVHQLQNPQQRLASQQGTVDWFCFWLKDEEDPNPTKAAQYTRWRELRKLQEKNEATRTPKQQP